MSSDHLNVDDISGLDEGIKPYVAVLLEHGIETFESCRGGEGHWFPEPTIRFHGGEAEGWKALAVAMQNGPLPVRALRRAWSVHPLTGPDGPFWEMVFREPAS